jgi:two-component system catabolic regulation response regulator CreB/two-component system response regulator ChvI
MQNHSKRILIVDDEPDITFTWKTALEDEGFMVDTFNDPILALSNFKANSYDLLLIDIRMSRMGGFDFYRQIREKDKEVRACFITAFEIYREQFGKLPTSRILQFIRKPIEIKTLTKLVRDTLNV